MTASAPILKFDDAAIEADGMFESSLCDISFELGAGELLLVLLDREHRLTPLADAACGLVRPVQGRVCFLGQDWQQMRVDAAAAQRGRINRLFPMESWVSNLDVDENILLAQRHHTRRPLPELEAEATRLASEFLLPGLPVDRPSSYRRQDLQKAACVRALMGEPVLIILERPTRDIYADVMSPLANAIYRARRRGTAVLWTTGDREVWADAGLKPTRRAMMAGARLHLCDSHAETISIPARQ